MSTSVVPPQGGPADLRRLRRAPCRGSLCLCLKFEDIGFVVRVFVCLFGLFGCLLIRVSLCFLGSLVGWLVVSMCFCLFFGTLRHNLAPRLHLGKRFFAFLVFVFVFGGGWDSTVTLGAALCRSCS